MRTSFLAILAAAVAACSGSAQAEKDPRCGYLIDGVSVFEKPEKAQKKWSKAGYALKEDKQISPRGRNMGMGETFDSLRQFEYSDGDKIYTLKEGETYLTWSEDAVYGMSESKMGVVLQAAVMGDPAAKSWQDQPYASRLKEIAKKYCGDEPKIGCRVDDNQFSINLVERTDPTVDACILSVRYSGQGLLREQVQYAPSVN